MDDAVHVTVVDALQDLLDAVRRVRLRVELARNDVLEQLAPGHAEGNRERYEGGLSISFSAIISLQPLGVGHATIPHIKAIDVPFHLIYGSLICA